MYILGQYNPNNGRHVSMENVRIEELPEELRKEVEKAAEDIRDETVDNNTAPSLPAATMRTSRRSQMRRKLRIPNLQQMQVMESQQFVVTIPDPDDPHEEWDILVQELSPGQNLILREHSFMRSAGAARARIDALRIKDEDNPTPEEAEMQAQIYQEVGFNEDWLDYQLEVCLLGIVEPAGLTKEIISKWSSNNIERIYAAINGGNEAVDAVDAFPVSDSATGDDQ